MASTDYLTNVTIGPVETQPTIQLVPYDPAWKTAYATERTKISRALGNMALQIEHVGSTSVAGLTAKPIIDILLLVPDAADEASYVPKLTAAGYVLRIREPNWHHHRMFRGTTTALHLHVFSVGCSEAQRMLTFRDWLRLDTTDRLKYQQVKTRLATQTWPTMQAYADAKSPIVTAINTHALHYFKQHHAK